VAYILLCHPGICNSREETVFLNLHPFDQQRKRRCHVVSVPDRPIANPLIVLREEFDDWAILFDPDSGKDFGLNPVSVFVWKRLDGRHRIDDILGEVRKACNGVPDGVEGHVTAFIQDLVGQGLAGYEMDPMGTVPL
jgi:SynChlorMet cassette protein ScmD